MRKGFPHCPMRSWRKRTGPPSESFTSTVTSKNTGLKTARPRAAKKRSNSRLATSPSGGLLVLLSIFESGRRY